MANRRRRGPVVNRRHMARLERERLITRYITIGSIVLVTTVVLLIAYGFIVARLIQPRQPVAIVNGDEILTREYQARVRYERSQLVSQWINLANLMTDFGVSDPSSLNFFIQQLQQIEFTLDPSTMGRTVLNSMVADRLVRQEAARRGITVSEEEITRELEVQFGFFGGGPRPTPTSAPTLPPTSTLSPLQMTLTAPTATPTLTITAGADITVTLVPTETEATEAPELTATAMITEEVTSESPTATPLPTSTPYSREAFDADMEENLSNLGGLGFTEADLQYLVESDLYRRKLLETITADIQQVQDQVWVRRILVATEEEALDVIARLEAGEDFAVLAQELSLDTTTSVDGGDLGWFTREQFPDIADLAFALEIGQVSDPVETQFGFDIIQLLGHEERSLTNPDFEDLKQTFFADWIDQLRQDADIETFDYYVDRTPNDPNVPAGGAQALLQQLQSAVPTLAP